MGPTAKLRYLSSWFLLQIIISTVIITKKKKKKKNANYKLFDFDSLILFIGSLLVYPKIHSCAKKGVCVW